jgi:hypothetical protein
MIKVFGAPLSEADAKIQGGDGAGPQGLVSLSATDASRCREWRSRITAR